MVLIPWCWFEDLLESATRGVRLRRCSTPEPVTPLTALLARRAQAAISAQQTMALQTVLQRP
jgi:hypothetical protein